MDLVLIGWFLVCIFLSDSNKLGNVILMMWGNILNFLSIGVCRVNCSELYRVLGY